jgi:hypothetical protein
MYSGRTNPEWFLTAFQATELKKKFKNLTLNSREAITIHAPSHFGHKSGYHGFIVESSYEELCFTVWGPSLVKDIHELELWLESTIPPDIEIGDGYRVNDAK